jgi:hypothetical protein
MDIYWNIFATHGPMNVKFPNNTRKWLMEFNSAFKGLTTLLFHPRPLSLSLSLSLLKSTPFVSILSKEWLTNFQKIHWCSIYIDVHLVIVLLVEHTASLKNFQALRSPAIPLTSFHGLSVFLISSSIFLRHVLFGLLLLLYPWGFQSNAIFSVAPSSLRNVCPIQFRFLLFIWISIGFSLVILHNSSLEILSVYFMFIIRLENLYINVCKLLVIWLEVFQVSHPYNNTDFIFILNICILTTYIDITYINF